MSSQLLLKKGALNTRWLDESVKLVSYMASVWRAVEDQETKATLKIVDNMPEQMLLEELLDTVKPPYREGTQGMHYLLRSAFRYPPLKYGSRFGTRLMPSFFYASERVETALCETAYHRFVFLDDMTEPYKEPINSSHSVFSVTVKSDVCLDLVDHEFKSLHEELVNIGSYPLCQKIGEWAVKERGAELIRFESARNRGSVNLAVAEPKAIRSKKPTTLQTWLCQSSDQLISFSSRDSKQLFSFSKSRFLDDGVLPRPA